MTDEIHRIIRAKARISPNPKPVFVQFASSVHKIHRRIVTFDHMEDDKVIAITSFGWDLDEYYACIGQFAWSTFLKTKRTSTALTNAILDIPTHYTASKLCILAISQIHVVALLNLIDTCRFVVCPRCVPLYDSNNKSGFSRGYWGIDI